jgi:hypothetical protein
MRNGHDLETIINPNIKRPSALRSLLPTARASKNACDSDKMKRDYLFRFHCPRRVEVIDGGR